MPASKNVRPLSKEQIIEAALDIMRQEGLEGVSMRAVAQRLGVTPMAVYYHVQDKEKLLQALFEHVTETAGPLHMEEGGWEPSLRRHLLSTWRALARYPGLSAYAIEQPDLGVKPGKVARGVEFFEEGGFPPHAAKLAWSFALTYIHGRISVDARFAHRADAVRLEGLHASDYVEFGVEAVIAGLRTLREQEWVPRGNPGRDGAQLDVDRS
jgi:AcrR family transcriptional regulator